MCKTLSLKLLASCLALTACGSEEPSFITQSLGKYYVEVAEGTDATDPNSIPVDNLIADDSTMSEGNPFSTFDEASGDDATGISTSATTSGDERKAGADQSRGRDDDDSAGGSAGRGVEQGGGSSNPPRGDSTNDDATKIAKSCAPHFKGLASSIRVLEAGAPDQALALSPDTVIAIRLSGNQDQVMLNLSGAQNLAGICLMLTGNQAKVTIESAASIQKLVYVGRGNESQGTISFVNGASLEQAQIELKGNQPRLTVSGIDSSLCAGARIQGNAASLQCNP